MDILMVLQQDRTWWIMRKRMDVTAVTKEVVFITYFTTLHRKYFGFAWQGIGELGV